MNVARLNFSHGDFEEHGNRIRNIRQAARELGKTRRDSARHQRTGNPPRQAEGRADRTVAGRTITLTTEEILGDRDRIPSLIEPAPGCEARFDDSDRRRPDRPDGRRDPGHGDRLPRSSTAARSRARRASTFRACKSRCRALRRKTPTTFVFGIEQGVDFIAASFVRKASDVLEIRELLEKHNAPATSRSLPRSKTSKAWTTWTKSWKCPTA